MSIAICFYGLHSGKNDKNEIIEYNLALNSIKKNIINFNKDKKFDIFFHTWNNNDNNNNNNDNNNELINNYKPCKYKIDNSIFFDIDIKWNSIMSRWYSHSEVLKLKKIYEIENNIKYEYVLIVRFDCIFLLNINFNFNNKNIYVSTWDDASIKAQETGLLDYWFILNSEDADIYSHIYNDLINYKIKYKDNMKSNHTIAKQHLIEKKIDYKLKYIFKEFVHFTLNKWRHKIIN